jgi:hypothetical protein
MRPERVTTESPLAESSPADQRTEGSPSANGSVAMPYELKSLGGSDYYIWHRDTDMPVAKLYRNITNKELLELKQYLDGKMPLND